jgi:hypothetical protein
MKPAAMLGFLACPADMTDRRPGVLVFSERRRVMIAQPALGLMNVWDVSG